MNLARSQAIELSSKIKITLFQDLEFGRCSSCSCQIRVAASGVESLVLSADEAILKGS